MLKHVNKKVRFQSLYLQQMINYMDKSAGAAVQLLHCCTVHVCCTVFVQEEVWNGLLRTTQLSTQQPHSATNLESQNNQTFICLNCGRREPTLAQGKYANPPHKDLCCPVYSNPGPPSFSEATVLPVRLPDKTLL